MLELNIMSFANRLGCGVNFTDKGMQTDELLELTAEHLGKTI